MKFKIILITYISIFLSTLSSQNKMVNTFNLNWNGVEKWYAGTHFSRFITFEDAHFPTENHLPYFNKKLVCDSALFYEAILVNPVYIPLTSEELDVINGVALPTEIEVKSTAVNEDGKQLIEVQVFPFINQQNKLVRLKSFEIQFKKKSQIQKSISTSTVNRTYAGSSVLGSGKFIKIRITDSGVYKLTYEDLNAMGVNPANVKVFGYGGAVLEQSFLLAKIDDLPEVAIWMEKGTDGVFNAGDYILFYGQGVNKWKYDTSKSIFTHQINSYSNYGYYFVTSDAGIGKRITEKSITLPTSPTIFPVEDFLDFQVHEKEQRNVGQTGKEFYGEKFDDVNTYSFNFNFPNPVLSKSILARIDLAATSPVNSTFTLNLNGNQSNTITIAAKSSSDNYELGKSANATYSFTPTSGNLTYNLTYSKPTTDAIGFLNYLELNIRRQLIMSGSAMQFQNVDNLGLNGYNQYKISNTSNNVQIWDITDQQNISKMPTTLIDGKLNFYGTSNEIKNYLAIDPTAKNAFPSPVNDGIVSNQNLHAINQADMIIISHPDFLSQAQRLAQAHRTKDNLTIEVVTTNQVYNEFSSGTPDATAYRWIMKMLYDRAGNNNINLPKYLLLFGRGSFDNRKLFTNSGDNFILTYQADNSLSVTSSYTTDDYFGILSNNQGSQISSDSLKLGIGRLPVANLQQATNVVDKLINYMDNQGKGNWKNQICFLADDGDAALHMKQSDSIAVSLARINPSFQLNKIYLDSYNQESTASGQSYPLAKSNFLNLIRSGIFMLNYTGHAGATGWANESILNIADIKSLSNHNLPLFYGATCDFLQYDVQSVSGGELIVLNPVGGGIGIISAARPVYASQNFTLNKYFCENLIRKKNGEQVRVGDALMAAKNSIGSEINKLSYIYMGDPALKLNFPSIYKVITSKVNQHTSFGNDTLRALSIDTIQGYIADNNGNKVTNFNGTLHATIYDKVQLITTLNNESDGTLTYSDRLNKIFSGNAKVENGVFSFSFMLPKDIKYNYGGGRINYYAGDDIKNMEAQGIFENFIVGGTDKNYTYETDGPTTQLFLNSENFVSGGKTNETPVFMANLSDINGINTVGGSGIGHDLSLTIDQDPSQNYILNDYFQSTKDSYTEGTVKYKLPEIAKGKHTLSFKSWDLLNNSTTNTIEFEVVKGLIPNIFKVYNYPNPVKSETSIFVEHDRPETVLSSTVEIFDLAGRKIWSFSQPSADKIKWDLKTADGLRVKTGVYLYRVSVKTLNSDVTTKTNKMLVVEQ